MIFMALLCLCCFLCSSLVFWSFLSVIQLFYVLSSVGVKWEFSCFAKTAVVVLVQVVAVVAVWLEIPKLKQSKSSISRSPFVWIRPLVGLPWESWNDLYCRRSNPRWTTEVSFPERRQKASLLSRVILPITHEPDSRVGYKSFQSLITPALFTSNIWNQYVIS